VPYMWHDRMSSLAEGGLPPLASLSLFWMFMPPSDDTYNGAHVILTLFLRIVLGLVSIVKGLSQYPIRSRVVGTMFAWHQETQETALASVIDLAVRHRSRYEQAISRRVPLLERRRNLWVCVLLAGYWCVKMIWPVVGGGVSIEMSSKTVQDPANAKNSPEPAELCLPWRATRANGTRANLVVDT
jgi:hypothetical protein